MSIALYSEGKRDFGDGGPFAEEQEGGPLQELVANLLERPDWLRFQPFPFGKVHGDGRAHGRPRFAQKILRALRDAARDGHEAVVCVVDRDGASDRLRHLQAGREEEGNLIPSALGVAQEMVEAWLLGDRGAWQRTFGLSEQDIAPHPETLPPGSPNPRSAKAAMEDLLAGVGGRRDYLADYTTVARQSDWRKVAAACPESFAPFAAEVRERIGRRVFRLKDPR